MLRRDYGACGKPSGV